MQYKVQTYWPFKSAEVYLAIYYTCMHLGVYVIVFMSNGISIVLARWLGASKYSNLAFESDLNVSSVLQVYVGQMTCFPYDLGDVASICYLSHTPGHIMFQVSEACSLKFYMCTHFNIWGNLGFLVIEFVSIHFIKDLVYTLCVFCLA